MTGKWKFPGKASILIKNNLIYGYFKEIFQKHIELKLSQYNQK